MFADTNFEHKYCVPSTLHHEDPQTHICGKDTIHLNYFYPNPVFGLE